MYACTVTRTDVGSAVTRCGKTHGSYATTRARTGGVHRVYPGGVYHSTPSVFERLDDENIRVAESLRYYPYRATFDFECWFDTEQLPSDSDQVHWVARHVPLSVSVASNVPGHEQVKCLVTDGDTNKLVSAMMDILRSMSDAAYDKIKDSYEYALELAEALTNWDEQEETARSATDKEARPATNPYKTLMGQLYGWMHQLPVIGFNSGTYDLNAIKQFLIPYFLSTAKPEEQEEEDEEEEFVGSYRGDKILLATPLLRWYLVHGLEVLHVYQVIEYDPIPCFRRFGDAVSTARREGDVHRDKTIIADTMKLLGNSGYGKTITNVDRHRDVSYCTEKAASLMVNDKRFRQLDIVVNDAYEIEMNKKTVKYTLPVHVGFFVLQYAKMRMLQFYYDFINRYVERPLFQYCEMDTDSAYLVLADESVDDRVTPALRIIISDIVPNGSRPNVATNIRTTTCAVASPIDRGSETRHAVRREERSTRGHRVCSRSSGPVTGSWGCVARRTIVSEPPTSTAPKD